MATRKALGRNPGGRAVIDPATVVNGLQHTTLALTWSDGRSDWARSVFLNLHLQQVPNPYLLVARRRWLRVNCVVNMNLTSAEKLATARKPTLNLSILVAYPPSRPRRMGYPPPRFIHNTSWTSWWVEERRASEKYTANMASSDKKN